MTVSLKEDQLVLITEDDGSLPLATSSALGLYYHDTQFLSGYRLRVNGTEPVLLSANTEQNYVATFQLMHSEGGATLSTARHTANTLSIRRTRFLADGLRERIGVLNANPRPVSGHRARVRGVVPRHVRGARLPRGQHRRAGNDG